MIGSAEEFIRLRTSDDPLGQRRATQDSATLEVWQEIIATYPEMKKWVIHNKTVPLAILTQLATDDDDKVRRGVACKRMLNSALFTLLAQDPNENVRYRIACNPKCPAETLEALTHDDSLLVSDAARDRAGLIQ